MPTLYGRIPHAPDKPLPERALLCAVFLSALKDAQHGDALAAGFLDAALGDWGALLGLRALDWRTAAAVPDKGPHRAAKRQLTWAERQARREVVRHDA